jgi:hypothetical protein
MNTSPKALGVGEFSLQLFAAQGESSCWAYLVEPGESVQVIEEIKAELGALDEELVVKLIESRPDVESLLHAFPTMQGDVLLFMAESYDETDWAVLDRQRSSLEAASRAIVFLTTPSSFEALMRVASNLSSWLGGFVFEQEDSTARIEERRAGRLEALRAWFGKTDEQVVREAESGTVPRDPAYAEWLSLLGRGDLLDA